MSVATKLATKGLRRSLYPRYAPVSAKVQRRGGIDNALMRMYVIAKGNAAAEFLDAIIDTKFGA